jgi:nitrate/TMAO reductase-like tetraheme cytochrome c subunit
MEVKKMKKTISFVVFTILISFNVVFGGNLITSQLPVNKLAPSETCASKCHQIGNIYDELSTSVHRDMECFECHLPAKVQMEKYNNAERGFHRLGYHKEGQVWEETPGNEACQRCHADQEMVNNSQKCWTCHMPENGKSHIVFPRQNNKKEIKTLPHKSHTFIMHIDKQGKP